MSSNDSQHTAALFNITLQQLERNTTNTHAVSLSAGSVVITTATLVLNAGVLLILLKEKALRTPFNVYIMVLLASNIVYIAILTPMSIVTTHVGYWWIGFSACTLNIYCAHIVVAITIHTHVLITINRTWALFWPIAYKEHHTARMAWLLSGLMIACVHLPLLPGIILDASYYRVSHTSGCFLNAKAQFPWYMFITIWVYDVPKLCIPVCYPFLLRKYLRRRTVRNVGRLDNAYTESAEPATRPTQTKRTGSRSFVLLTLFTIAAVVCWIPGIVYYILVSHVPESELVGLNTARSVLYLFVALMDPIFFYITNLHGYIANRLRRGLTRDNGIGNDQRAGLRARYCFMTIEIEPTVRGYTPTYYY